MNNPFLRFKHYRIHAETLAESKENHATECLAAALIFSEEARRIFLEMLFKNDPDIKESESYVDDIEVLTQQTIDGGQIDLLLRSPEKWIAVIEVKVGDSEDERHKDQLLKYKRWLPSNAEPCRRLFTLVQNPDPKFTYTDYGVQQNGRHTWEEVYHQFHEAIPRDPTHVIQHLCDYLNMENIASKCRISDLLKYADGMRAKSAINQVFKQLSLSLEYEGFETETVIRDDAWPRIQIGHAKWSAIFGSGLCQRLWLWFATPLPESWGGTKHEFCCTLELFGVELQDDWNFIKPKIRLWINAMEQNYAPLNFEFSRQPPDCTITKEFSVENMQKAPRRIYASSQLQPNELQQPLPLDQMDQQGLQNHLISLVHKYAEVLTSLK